MGFATLNPSYVLGHAMGRRVHTAVLGASRLFPSPIVGEGGRDAPHRGRVRGLSPRTETPHPARFARHLLPQGEKGRKAKGGRLRRAGARKNTHTQGHS